MAEGLSATLANALLNAVFRNTVADGTLSLPIAEVWVQLHTAAPGAAGTTAIATETDRIQGTFGTNAASGAIANTAVLTWTGVAGAEDYTHATLWTASVGGTFLGSGTVTANAVLVDDTFTIPIGDLDVSLPVAS